MKHKKFLSDLSDEEIVNMIDDYFQFHFETRTLPVGSKIREFSVLVSVDFQEHNNLPLAEKIFMEFVMKRYRGLVKSKTQPV